MPALTLEFLNSLQENFKNYPIFVETGTYNGDTMENLQ